MPDVRGLVGIDAGVLDEDFGGGSRNSGVGSRDVDSRFPTPDSRLPTRTGPQAKQIGGKRGAVKVKVDVARSGNAHALDALDRQQPSGKLFGNLTWGLTKLFGQLETGGNRELPHFDGGRIAQSRHTRVDAEGLANDLGKSVANFL